ncbi:hypothetical protein [Vibrio sp. AND4]|uniref:hypothetical protein n=1 Tax=Vibrio sp. AND4 TaxID=314289 RepID=UPI00015F19C6|nr:hypothetical protein [Vibrio sp. AND4]EDP57802.1 surface protein Lk90-like protein [Vibrio sp. AND4]
MFSQHIIEKIKNAISLICLLIIIAPLLTACGSSSGGSDGNDGPTEKKLERITIERVSENNVLAYHEALSDTIVTFKAIGYYDDGSHGNITSAVQWISANPTLASFDSSAQLKTHKIGKTNIVAKINDITSTWPISILKPISITLSPSIKPEDFDNNQILYVPKGTSITLESIVEWSDGSKRDGKGYVSWMIDNTSFAQDIYEKNRFRAVGSFGEISYLNTTFCGIRSNTVSLEITNSQLKKIVIGLGSDSKKETQLKNVLYGTSRKFTAFGVYQDPDNSQASHSINITKDVKWTSSNPDIFYNKNNSNVFTAYSRTANSSAVISAKMFNLESNPQELTTANATLSNIEIVSPNKSEKLISGIETSLYAVGHYLLESDSSESIAADLTPFVNWSTSDEESLKQVDSNTFLPSTYFGRASVTVQTTDKKNKSSKEFVISPGKLEKITISEIHNYPNPTEIPLYKSRTFKAIGVYSVGDKLDKLSFDITKRVSWQLEQPELKNPFIQKEDKNTIEAIGLTQGPAELTAISLTNDIQSNTLYLTSFPFKTEFKLRELTFSLSPLMTNGDTSKFVFENDNIWGVEEWQSANESCKEAGKKLVTEKQLIMIEKTIGSLGFAYGWPTSKAKYWTSTHTDKINHHISRNLSIGGGSYEEENTTKNFSICVN